MMMIDDNEVFEDEYTEESGGEELAEAPEETGEDSEELQESSESVEETIQIITNDDFNTPINAMAVSSVALIFILLLVAITVIKEG